MISARARGIHHLSLLAQCILVTLGFWGWFLLCNPSAPLSRGLVGDYLVYNEFVLLGLLVSATFFRVPTSFVNPTFESANRQALRQLGLILFYLLLYIVALRDRTISRTFLFSFGPLLYCLLFMTNRYLPPLLGNWVLNGKRHEKVLLVGPAEKTRRLNRWLERSQPLGLEVVGVLCDDRAKVDSQPVLGCPAELEKVLNTWPVTQVVLAEFPAGAQSLRDSAALCERHGVRFLVVNDLDDRFGHPVTQHEDQGLYLIGLREEPLENPFNRATKRLLDIAISLPVVVFILPILTAIVWLCQRVQSPGPIFYLQARPGIHNRPFNILKYRTLHVDNPDVNRLPSAGDRRLYPAGRLMRKRSLDELPQFLNVLRGDMSVVGPRPHLWAHNDLFPTIFNKAYVRSFVKPGITGLAQVRGLRGQIRCGEDVVRRMEADIHYLENWSFWLDCWLIFRTLLQVTRPPRSAI